jgi:hypothetical protein
MEVPLVVFPISKQERIVKRRIRSPCVIIAMPNPSNSTPAAIKVRWAEQGAPET